MYKRNKSIFFILMVLIPLTDLFGQTRFARPDTTPDYTSYRHIDECIAAIKRLKEDAVFADSVWSDTLDYRRTTNRRLPQQVVEYAKVCASKIDIDSAQLKDAHLYAAALLVADRDKDVERMYKRLEDTLAKPSSTGAFWRMVDAYRQAVPTRLDKVLYLHDRALEVVPPDSARTNLSTRISKGFLFLELDSISSANQTAREILAITDTLSDKYRVGYYDFHVTRPGFAFFERLMTQEAIDSLAISTDAYASYLSRIWQSLKGHNSNAEMGPFASQAPAIKGKYWYSNLNESGNIQPISPAVTTGPGVKILYFVQGGCHSNYLPIPDRGRDNGKGSCWASTHKIRKILEKYPGTRLTIVSNTFGSFADAPPLNPQQEADTLANYFLGFHGLKGIQVVYETEFIRLAGHDRRKVDLETENQVAYDFGDNKLYKNNTVVLIDELGKIFYYGSINSRGIDAKIETVMSRPANRQLKGY